MKNAGNKNSARIVTLSDLGTHTHTQNASNNKNGEIKDTHTKITLDALAAD